ncbi:unnamed protein product [Cylindrotheca closterium]|uniref:Uncharacterized protein n=1 Tax=Cylindrotheca closterium TaxID=2856 RepID=A0AAD2FNG2_9STRA|nr:unnamed protein product [Cylindrotheca closterium]
MSESGSLVSEEIIEEEVVIVEDEEEVHSVEYIIEEEEVTEVDFNDVSPSAPPRNAHRRQSLVSEYVEMSVGSASELMSLDDLNDVTPSEDNKQKTKTAYRYSGSESGDSTDQQSSDDADATNSSDGFDLTLPETSNMENMHMSGLTTMDFTQSGMINFESSYMFELVDTDDEEEDEVLGNTNVEAAPGMNLSLNPYRVTMDKVRYGPLGKRRSTGITKRKSTSRDLSPIRQQVTDYLENVVEAQSARKGAGAPRNRVAPARTMSSSRRAKRRSLITSPIHEDKPHAPRGGRRSSLLANLPPPNFFQQENDAKPSEPSAITSKPNNDFDEPPNGPTKAVATTESNPSEASPAMIASDFPPDAPVPNKTIAATQSNPSEVSPTTAASDFPPVAAVPSKAMATTGSDPNESSPATAVSDFPPGAPAPTKTMAATKSNPIELSPTTAASDFLPDAPVPTKATSASTSSNRSEPSISLHASGPRHSRQAKSVEEERNQVQNHQVPTRTIATSNSNSSELSPHPMRHVNTTEEETTPAAAVRNHQIPKDAIARSNNSELSPLTASGHRRGANNNNKIMEGSASGRNDDRRIPTKSISAASNSDSSELSPLTFSGHPMRQTTSKLEGKNPSLSPMNTSGRQTPVRNDTEAVLASPNMDSPELSPLAPFSGHAVAPRPRINRGQDRTPPPPVARVRGRSRADSEDTDKHLFHGIMDDDNSSWSKAEGRVLEIQIPAGLMDNPQDSFSTLDSESLAADSLMSSTRFDSTPQQAMSKRSSDISPVPPRRQAPSPKLGDGKEEAEASDFSSSYKRRGGRKQPLGSEEGSRHRRRTEGMRRRSLDLASVSEKHNQSFNMDNSILSTSMHNMSTSMHNAASGRRGQMRRDLSMSSFTNHSRRNLMKRQTSVSSFANNSRRNLLSRQNSMSSSRRNQMSRTSSKRSVVDESPSMPKRYLSVDVDLEMSISSLTSKAEESRQRRIARDQSPMRPRRTLEKVVSPGVNIEDDEDSMSEGSFANDAAPNQSLPIGSLPSSMRIVAPVLDGPPMRDVSPMRPRRTISTKRVPVSAAVLFGDEDDKALISKETSPNSISPKDKIPEPLTSAEEEMEEPEKPKSTPPTSSIAEEKKETEMPIVLDYIPPPPPLPRRGVPVEELRGRSKTTEIKTREQADARISPLPQPSTEKEVKNLKASPSPTEITANTEDSEYIPSVDKQSPATSTSSSVSEVGTGLPVQSSKAIISQKSDASNTLAPEKETAAPSPDIEQPRIEPGSLLRSSTHSDASFLSSSSTAQKRAQAQATLERLNSRMNSTFGDGVKAQTTADLRDQQEASAVPTVEGRRSSLEEKRQEAKAARERLRQRFINARARVQSQLPV